MTDAKKNTAIGVVVTIGIALFVWVLLFLHPQFGDSRQQFHVRFADIDKVGKGSRVTFAGRPVGHVIGISTIDRQSPTEQGPIYCYDVLIAIDSHVTVYETDEIMLSTSGLMGERYIAITPKPAQNPKILTKDEIVYATELPTVTDVIQAAGKNLQDFFNSAKNSSQNFDKVCENFNKSWPEIIAAFDTFSSLSKRSAETAQELQTFITKVNTGEGSLGKFVSNDEFYYKTLALMNKVDVLIHDLNNYGLMYQWNKEWKKDQANRDLTLAKLKDPQEFNQFLQDKYMKISTSINSIKMAAQAAQGIDSQVDKNSVANSFTAVLQELETLQEEMHTANNPLFLKEEVATDP